MTLERSKFNGSEEEPEVTSSNMADGGCVVWSGETADR